MTGLLDHHGNPMIFAKKKAPVALGEAFGPWAGENTSYLALPGGSVLQFDLSRLRLSDFRQMKSHYQVEASLSVLTFMLHQLEWKIVCDDSKVAEHVADNLHAIWTRLVRAKSQAFWAGYSPNALQWENDAQKKTVQLTKIKDLLPEDSRVHWKDVDGWAPPGRAANTAPIAS